MLPKTKPKKQSVPPESPKQEIKENTNLFKVLQERRLFPTRGQSPVQLYGCNNYRKLAGMTDCSVGEDPLKVEQSVGQMMIPNNFVKRYKCSEETRVYGGQFSKDGDMFYASSQDSICTFDSSDPYNFKREHYFLAQGIHWTITDTDLHPDNRHLLYSSISSTAYLVDMHKQEIHMLPFSSSSLALHDGWGIQGGFYSLWSIQFSGDGKQILAGGNSRAIFIYDLHEKRVVEEVRAHLEDVNTVAWANKDSSHIVFSGGDDCLCFIWDRRILGPKNRPAGVLVGHTEGITHISSKGDERYLISNGKDQQLKEWDLRKMSEYSNLRHLHINSTGFDYRWDNYPRQTPPRMKEDTSIHTYSGHSVLKTLIRCYYSPSFTTNQRYIITGSADGRVYIYDIYTGECVEGLQTVDGGEIRDVAWHPAHPLIAATSFHRYLNTFKYSSKPKEVKRKNVSRIGSFLRMWMSGIGGGGNIRAEVPDDDEGSSDEDDDGYWRKFYTEGGNYIEEEGALEGDMEDMEVEEVPDPEDESDQKDDTSDEDVRIN